MFVNKYLLLTGCLLLGQSANGVFWSCSEDSDCDMEGGVCLGGTCGCPSSQQAVGGGTVCAAVPPYHTSECFEDFQCTTLVTNFQCRRQDASDKAGQCYCAPGNHYFRGRCWTNTQWEQPCSTDEECLWVLNDPFSMLCRSGACACADGYYLRQRGECRKSGLAVGDGCVVDEDCRFDNGACFVGDFTCYNVNDGVPEQSLLRASQLQNQLESQPEAQLSSSSAVSFASNSYGTVCGGSVTCPAPLVCTNFGVCHCPRGYYPNAEKTVCLAELGSPVTTPDQCVGLFTEVRDGLCTCQPNFYFAEDMRSCVKMVRFLSDGCMSDANCHTFGVHASCGPPQQWGLRNCQCDLKYTVWDPQRLLCRLFSGIGESCDVDSDCLAGDMQAVCVQSSEGQKQCACPDGYFTHEGLCLMLGLNLGDTCQLSLECTGAPNSVCSDGVCVCDEGYQAVGSSCAPALGGSCAVNFDCLIDNTVCSAGSCQCSPGFVEDQAQCWPRVSGHGAACQVSGQCSAELGSSGVCIEGLCGCKNDTHYRDGSCWPQIGLFQSCARSSECFLSDVSERVHCRNSICQCTFDYPYSEELGTCRSSAAAMFGNSMIIMTAIFYLFSR